MDRILIVGVDTVVGANLALYLSEKYIVSTWHPTEKFDIANCDALDPADAPRSAILKAQADCVIHCGPAARSCWDSETKRLINETVVEDAENWATAASEARSQFVFVSSDAVFTGPWMFHEENCPGHCPSLEATTIRAAETVVQKQHPEALIVRTNTYGWSADPIQNGWIENLLSEVELRRFVEQDAIRHASPILATDLAAIIERACLEGLSGVFHIAGAERVSPLKFTQRLADLFALPWLSVKKETTLVEVPCEFGAGECSLQTKEIRKALCVAMPLLSEGLQRLREQAENGYREKLSETRDYRTVRKAA